MSCGDKFWADRPKDLLCTYEVIPTMSNSRQENFNSITRLFILIVIAMYAFGVDLKYTLPLFIVGIITIVAVYKMTNKEDFVYSKSMTSVRKNPYNPYSPHEAEITYDTVNAMRCLKTQPNYATYIDDATPLSCIENPRSITSNQKLAGCANPKTLIPPPMVPPAYASEFWNSSSMNIVSQINDQTNVDVYRSGYFVSAPTEYGDSPMCTLSTRPQDARHPNKSLVDISKMRGISIEEYSNSVGSCSSGKENAHSCSSSSRENQRNTQGKKDSNSISIEEYAGRPRRNMQYDSIDTGCGYNKQNLRYNIPINVKAGNCNLNNDMAEYNKNLYTQTIQPNVYTQSQVAEPINSNIGISFAQEFEPTVKTSRLDGTVKYVQYTPDEFDADYAVEENQFIDTRANTYDPRFTGYGSSSRMYIEPTTEQPRFMYDDVQNVNAPNYLSRSNIDFLPSVPYSYDSPNDTRKMVEQAWTNSSIAFRTDLQEQLMRKMNVGKWQQRVAPIHKTNQRMLGGMRIC